MAFYYEENGIVGLFSNKISSWSLSAPESYFNKSEMATLMVSSDLGDQSDLKKLQCLEYLFG
jgi:hypothetical protein